MVTVGLPAASLGAAPVSERRARAGATTPEMEGRTSAIWREWIATLAESGEAALAAAIAYQALGSEARVRWLEALEQEAPYVTVPLVAAYGPLLAVETDRARRDRMEAALRKAPSEVRTRAGSTCSVFASPEAPVRRIVVVVPTYLEFRQVVICRVETGRRFLSVSREPFVLPSQGPLPGETTPEGQLEALPLPHAVDLLARTIVAHQRAYGPLPDELRCLAGLFEAS